MVPQRIHAVALNVRSHGIYVYGPYLLVGTSIMLTSGYTSTPVPTGNTVCITGCHGVFLCH